MNKAKGHLLLSEFEHEELPLWFDEYLENLGVNWGDVSEDDFGSLALRVMTATPRRFAECFLYNRPNNGGTPWRFFDYQRESVDYLYSVINESAKGTGKTREIVAFTLWTLYHGGDILFGAHSAPAITTIFNELCYQIEAGPSSTFLSEVCPQILRGNVKEIKGWEGNTAYFLTTSREGRQFHSVHIHNGYLLADEADLWPNEAWSAFLSRGETVEVDDETCRTYVRAYSVPNGRGDSVFAELGRSAIPIRAMINGGEHDGLEITDFVRFTQYAFVHWERPMMPYPFWGEEAKAIAIRDYGPPESAEYRIYVLGRRSSPKNAAFPWSVLRHACIDIPEFRLIRLIYDQDSEAVNAEALHSLGSRSLETISEDSFESDCDGAAYYFDQGGCRSVDLISVDAGRNQDPTQILLLKETSAPGLRVVGRIELRFAPTSFQWRTLRDLFKELKPKYGIGIESSANSLGLDLYDNLVDRKVGGLPKKLVTPVEWNHREELLDDRGMPIWDDNRHKVERNLKEASTVRLENLLEKQKEDPAKGFLELPHSDSDFRTEMSSHQVLGKGRFGRKFTYHGDDIVESLRVAAWIWHLRTKRVKKAVSGGSRPTARRRSPFGR